MVEGTTRFNMNFDWIKGKSIGCGSFGVVNLAMIEASGKLFVVKSSVSGPGFQSLSREANILANLDSPHIIKNFGHEIEEEKNEEIRFNLFMEYMAGGNLSQIIEKFRGSLGESVIRSYTTQILKGLQHLHCHGIVHGDLKCKNLLVDSSGNVKLADFGCATILHSSEQSIFPFCGTPLWMAPEVLQTRKVEESSDIWSLACTVIEMATGKPPWSNVITEPMAAIYKIAFEDSIPELPANFSEEGLDFLKKCLQRNPESRWSCDQLLDHPFITGTSINRDSSKQSMHSPTGILDIISSEKEQVIEFPRAEDCQRITSLYKEQKLGKNFTWKPRRWNDYNTSENWVDVRTG